MVFNFKDYYLKFNQIIKINFRMDYLISYFDPSRGQGMYGFNVNKQNIRSLTI